jgi:asparagine synthase (glutamine-hydrolysing)
LAAVATEVAGTRLRTISVGFDQSDFDETTVAARVAGALGTEHSTLKLTGESVLADLPEALAAIDQPTVDGFNTFFVSRAARRAGLSVALSGLGGDELFGGYASFRDVPRARRWHSARGLLGPLAPTAGWALGAVRRRATAKMAELFVRPNNPVHRYLLRRELFLPAQRRELHPLPPEADPYSGLPRDFLHELDDEAADHDPVNQVSRLELTAYMGHMLLRDSDVFSMACGVELRVPLLDHELLTAVVRLPGQWKLSDPRPKPLLIDAAGPRLPTFLHQRPKMGFTLPWGAWIRGPLRARVAQAVRHGDLWAALGFAPAGPSRVWSRFEAGDPRLPPLGILALVVIEDFITRHGLSVA